jgi:hypothetical protein
MTRTALPQRSVRSCRAVAARAVRRELEAKLGPRDGERLVLEAGECSIDLPAGRYVAVGCTSDSETTEHLQWIVDE